MELEITGKIKAYSLKAGGETLTIDVEEINDIETLKSIIGLEQIATIKIKTAQQTLDESGEESI